MEREMDPDRPEGRSEYDWSRLDTYVALISTWLIPSGARLFLPAVAVWQPVASLPTPHAHRLYLYLAPNPLHQSPSASVSISPMARHI